LYKAPSESDFQPDGRESPGDRWAAEIPVTGCPIDYGRLIKMPIYEYECTKCGTIEEALQKFSDKPLTRCRHCKGKLTKLVSQSTFHLKGSGWYATDYANKSKSSGKPSKKTKQSKTDGEKSSSSGSDNKKAASE
jgi:putative FmdB family regulatory protein